MFGNLVPLGPVPHALVDGALVLACFVLLIVALRRGGRGTADVRPAAVGQRPLEQAVQKAENTERLLMMIPDCTKGFLTGKLDESEVAKVACRQVKSLLDPEVVAVFRYDPARRLLDLASGVGAASWTASGGRGLSVKLGAGRIGMAAEHQTLVDDAKYKYERRQTAEDLGSAGVPVDLAAPIVFEGELLGVIGIRRSRQLPADQRWLLMMVAELAAVAIYTARKRVGVEKEAETDPLTGLFNRKHLETRLGEEMVRAESYDAHDARLAVLLFDVDNFKHYNDRNGHPAGDECLKAVARVTKSVTRAGHVVFRYGGEEFLVLAPDATLEQAMTEAERIRAAIAAAKIDHAAAQPLGCLSVSIGVAAFPTHGRTGRALIEAADAALYRSKQTGRNRVTAASDGFLSEGEALGVQHG